MKKNIKRVLIFSVLVVAGAVVLLSLPNKEVESPFRTEPIARGTISNAVVATGTISPEEVINVGTQVSGQITGLYAKLNDEVKKDQVLAEIDPKIPLTQLRQSRASLETAQNSYELSMRDYERTKALVAKDYVAKVDLERAEQSVISARNSLESAKIQVERDEVNLSYTKVTSPIDGVIISQQVSSGQTLASNFQTPNLYVIAKSLKVMKIDVNIPESDISNIRLDMPVTFTVDAFPDRTFDGAVTSISLNSNNQQGVVTYTVVVSLKNEDRALLPGMTATVNLTLFEKKDVLKVPAAALRFEPPQEDYNVMKDLFTQQKRKKRKKTRAELSQQSVYVLRGGVPVLVPINVGATDELFVEVLEPEPLKEGEEPPPPRKEGEPEPLKEGDLVITGLLPTED